MPRANARHFPFHNVDERLERPTPMNRQALALITLGHFFIDLCQGVVVAWLPFLIAAGEVTYQAAGGLVLATSAASSIVQPAFGHLSDRLHSPWLLPLSILVTGLALSCGSLMPSYGLLIGSLAVSGIGVAAFHPDGARQARRAAGSKAGTAMSVFAFGGGVGFAMAPFVTPVLMDHFGRPGVAYLIVPATFVVAFLIARRFRGHDTTPSWHTSHATAFTSHVNAWGAFLLLSAAVIARSIVFVGLTAFLATYWMSQFGATPAEGSVRLGIYLWSGLFGTLLGGRLGDRLGHRFLMRGGFLVAMGLFPLMLSAPAGWAEVLLVPLAISYAVPWSMMMVLGQEYLPTRLGIANGVTLGLSVSFGGISADALGAIADAHGIGAVFTILEVVMAIGLVLAFLLPQPRRGRSPIA